MKQTKRFFAAALVLLLTLTLCPRVDGGQEAAAPGHPAGVDGYTAETGTNVALFGTVQTAGIRETSALKGMGGNTPQNTRPSYNVGNCRTLEGKPYVVVIYLDDCESSWTESGVLNFNQTLVQPALDFLEEHASRWGVRLDLEMGYYATYGHPNRPVKYNGRVGRFLENNDYSRDILDQAAMSLGFSSKEDMHDQLVEYSGREQIAYLIMLNKGGRSYTIAYDEETAGGSDRYKLEYCVIFAGFEDDSYDSASDTVAHEMLHLFGADDYYMPDSRKALAQKYYPDDLMLCAKSDLKYFDLGDYTAYCVGWTDTVPSVCSEPGWWG